MSVLLFFTGLMCMDFSFGLYLAMLAFMFISFCMTAVCMAMVPSLHTGEWTTAGKVAVYVFAYVPVLNFLFFILLVLAYAVGCIQKWNTAEQ